MPVVADKVDDAAEDVQCSAGSRGEETLCTVAKVKLETVSAAAKQMIQLLM